MDYIYKFSFFHEKQNLKLSLYLHTMNILLSLILEIFVWILHTYLFFFSHESRQGNIKGNFFVFALWSGYLIFIIVGKSFYLITFVHEATIISHWQGIKGKGKVEMNRIWSFLFLLSCSFWFVLISIWDIGFTI